MSFKGTVHPNIEMVEANANLIKNSYSLYFMAHNVPLNIKIHSTSNNLFSFQIKPDISW